MGGNPFSDCRFSGAQLQVEREFVSRTSSAKQLQPHANRDHWRYALKNGVVRHPNRVAAATRAGNNAIGFSPMEQCAGVQPCVILWRRVRCSNAPALELALNLLVAVKTAPSGPLKFKFRLLPQFPWYARSITFSSSRTLPGQSRHQLAWRTQFRWRQCAIRAGATA
ncbi:hypothetical protein DJICPGNB_11760 [Escherichia coli]|nr:hypothetical protein DJICPGNB_11760 [Escherichia coli]